jgi:hypothetical protein
MSSDRPERETRVDLITTYQGSLVTPPIDYIINQKIEERREEGWVLELIHPIDDKKAWKVFLQFSRWNDE